MAYIKLKTLIIIILLTPLMYIPPPTYAVDAIDYCLSDLTNKQNSTYAEGTGWNVTASGSNCIFISTDPGEDGSVNDSPGHIAPYSRSTTGLNLGIIFDHPSDYEMISYYEFDDLSIIPDIANITDVDLGINDTSGSQNWYFYNMTNRPSISSNQTVFDDAQDGTLYLNWNAVTEGAYNLDMGTDADDELEAKIAAGDNWVAFGVMNINGISWQYMRSEEDPGSGDYPYLKITYRQRSTSPFGSLSFSSDQTSLFIGQTLTFDSTYSYADSGVSGLTLDVQRSEDNATWTNVISQVTDGYGNIQVAYSQGESGTYYFRSNYTGDDYPGLSSSTITIEFNPVSGNPPPGQQPPPSEQPPEDEQPPPEEFPDLWCLIFGCPEDGEDQPPIITTTTTTTDGPALENGITDIEDIFPIIRPIVEILAWGLGEDLEEEGVSDFLIAIAWLLLLLLLILLILIALFGRKGKGARG